MSKNNFEILTEVYSGTSIGERIKRGSKSSATTSTCMGNSSWTRCWNQPLWWNTLPRNTTFLAVVSWRYWRKQEYIMGVQILWYIQVSWTIKQKFMEQRIVFEDKNVSYKTFLEDLATFLAPKIALLIKNPPKSIIVSEKVWECSVLGMCVVGLRKASSNLFQEKGKDRIQSQRPSGVTPKRARLLLKQRAMYRIKKTLSSSREATLAYRPPREVEAFVLCPCQGIEECKLALHNLGEDIKQQELSWKRGKFLLSYIRDITEKDDEIIISYKGGKPCVSFKIEESKA